MVGLAATGLLLSRSSEARADKSNGFAVLAAIGVFDLAALPADLYFAASGKPVPHSYALAESTLGGAQVLAGGIGAIVCATDRSCKSEPWLPLLFGYTLWSTVMTIHGTWSLATAKTPASAPLAPRSASSEPQSFLPVVPGPAPFGLTARPSFGSSALQLTVAPVIGDGRTTPVGIGLVGSF